MNDRGEADRHVPQLALPDQRMAAMFVLPPHPTVLPAEELLADCEQRFQRRSGPGGQHRNKTSSGVFLTHRPAKATIEIVAEATERRSQADNRAIAMKRLRYQLAIEIRTPSIFDHAAEELEAKVRDKYRGGNLKINEENTLKPAVIAMLLNDLHAAGGQPSMVATQWKVSTSALVQILKSQPAAFAWTNRCRQHHHRRDLK